MAKPRRKNGNGLTFPYSFEKNGRKGRIKKWGDGKFGTYFMFASKKHRNSFATFEAAHLFLEHEFSKLDSDSANSVTLHPLRHDVKTYHELEQLLRDQGGGATLREAVEFFLAHHASKRFKAKTVAECVEAFLAAESGRNLSGRQIATLKGHLTPFAKDFGTRKIHELTALEIGNWLASRQTDEGQSWSAKTRKNVRGSLVSMSLYAQETLKAIPQLGKTEFQLVKNPKTDQRREVDIYTPDEITRLLAMAIEHDIDLIPAIVLGCFAGLRPDEFHGEESRDEHQRKPPLGWEAFNWDDKRLHIKGQKVRSKKTRDVNLFPAAYQWLSPFKDQTGKIWRYKKAYDDKMRSLFAKVELPRLYDAFRHSYASYRIRHLKGDLAQLAMEMGNSPQEIINSYRRNVTDEQADKWFNIAPPSDYAEKIGRALALRQAA
jgi:integrase